MEKVKQFIFTWHLKGCIKGNNESAIEYSQRLSFLQKFSDFNRSRIDWVVFLDTIDFDSLYRGWWRDVTLPIEGYQEIAVYFGRFMNKIEKVKKDVFEKKGFKVDGTVIHGCIEDLEDD